MFWNTVKVFVVMRARVLELPTGAEMPRLLITRLAGEVASTMPTSLITALVMMTNDCPGPGGEGNNDQAGAKSHGALPVPTKLLVRAACEDVAESSAAASRTVRDGNVKCDVCLMPFSRRSPSRHPTFQGNQQNTLV